MLNNKCEIRWHKTCPEAIIPTKRSEDAGFDIYTIKEKILLPHETELFPTGLQAAATPGWWLVAKDRGSTGSRGIQTGSGIIDNGFRGEIWIVLTNINDFPIVFDSRAEKISIKEDRVLVYGKSYEKVMYYPISKAIAQIIPIPQPEVNSYEVDDEEWEQNYAHNSERGTSQLGQSGK